MSISRKQIVSVGTLVAVVVFGLLVARPGSFGASRTVVIDEGISMSEAAGLLEENGIVYSSTVVRLISYVRGADTMVKAGEYLFKNPTSAWNAVLRLAHGEYGVEPLRVRLLEGTTRTQMADVLSGALNEFDRETFLAVTEDKEGYLFPDTYLFLPNTSAEDVATHLEETFFERINGLEASLILSGRTLEEIVILASIIEREAYDSVDQHLISGVLRNRLELGMALQVDASFFFLLGKASSELTLEDLKIDSPYNTYLYPGLPPGPIANPGLGAIEAALKPTPSDYIYYLSDENGVTHYAETFEGHKENKRIYLP